MMMNKKMKLVQVTHDLDLGGLQRVIVNICRSIDRTRFDVSVLCLRNLGCFTNEVERMDIPVTLIKQKDHGTDYTSFLKVATFFKENKPDVIHTHNTQPFIDGVVGAKIAGIKRIIHTDHARAFPDKRRYMFLEWLMSQYTFKVVGVSEDTSRNLKKYEHMSVSKVVTIPNGIDPVPFQVTIDKQKKRKEIGLMDHGPVIGVAVRLAEQKGITYLLKAMPEIIVQYPDISLVIVGDGPIKKDLIRQAEELRISQNVIFTGLRLDIPELLKLFDIYVLPSLWEGLPMVVLEAMAAGCPVIATDVGGVSTAVQHNISGLLVKPESAVELSSAILRLLSNEYLRAEFAKKAKSLFDLHFSANVMTAKYMELYVSKN